MKRTTRLLTMSRSSLAERDGREPWVRGAVIGAHQRYLCEVHMNSDERNTSTHGASRTGMEPYPADIRRH